MSRFCESSAQKFSVLVQLLDRKLLRPFYMDSQYGLSPLQINVLLLLDKDAAPSMSDIANQLDISKPNVTPIVDRLILDGYATRQSNPNDRRIINIRATKNGEKLIRTIRSDMQKKLEQRFTDCSDDSIRDFLCAMDQCICFLESLNE